ncbi:HAD family hydrolase [Desulfovibrio inopinatus]|uniref:HAD family hydrolase n=1 Tax=Desulfovibrio inopinatus TaxID=102109 RepID=UPI00146FAC96|nr:HAD family hydrolase [Desulfovibrio inopinatus]
MCFQYDVVLFDFDGTLADSQYAIVHCMEKSFESHAIPIPGKEEMTRSIGLPIRETFIKLGRGAVSEKKAEAMATTYTEQWYGGGKDLVQLFPRAFESLQQLADMPIRVGLVSNKKQRGLDDAVSVFGLGALVDIVVGAQDGLAHKPHASFFSDAVRPLCQDVPTERILMVGDAEPDLLFAANVGMHACWASYGYGHPTQCRQLHPHFTIDDIGQIPGIVSS